jgi:RNA polymerase sigma factor (sigma-70 family)
MFEVKMTEEKMYEEVGLIAYNISLKILKNLEDAEDIAQEVMVKFVQVELRPVNTKAWIRKVARNKSVDKLRKKEVKTVSVSNLSNFSEPEENEIYQENYDLKKARQYLNDKEFGILRLYIKYNKNTAKTAEKLNKTEKATRDAIYRIKKNYLASVYLKKGWRGTRKIISFNLHTRIKRFLKEFMKKNSSGELHTMKHYFHDIDVKESEFYDIVTPHDYRLTILKNGDFRLWFPYFNKEKFLECIIFDFKEVLYSKIRIFSMKCQRKNILVIKKNVSEFKKSIKPLKDGLPQESNEESTKIMLKHGAVAQDELKGK